MADEKIINGTDIDEKEEKSFTMELFDEIKRQSKRWMIAFFVIISLWFATIGGFIWYLNQYDFQSYDQDGDYNNINTGTQGDVNNGTPTVQSETKEKR